MRRKTTTGRAGRLVAGAATLAAVGAVLGAAFAATVRPAAADPDPAADLRGVERGRGALGEWILAWRYDGFDDAENHFRAVMGPERPFPHCAAVIGGRDRELVFFDGDGHVVEKVQLHGDEDALPCADGTAYLAWSPHPTSRRLQTYRYHLRGSERPLWEASAVGEPLLFAPDGSLFVIASADTGHDGYQRMLTHPGGTVQVVDASGGVLGELPIRPAHVRLTGDHARIAMLHAGELVVLRADGRLDWNVDVPVDALLQREGLSQLEAAGGVIAVSGTGESRESTALRPKRTGTIEVFNDAGRLLWKQSQPDDEALWFQVSCALSPDGGTLATFHTDARELVVQVWDARHGEPLWRRSVPRAAGGRRLSVAPNGELIVLAWGDLRTSILAWDREGTLVWEGTLPYPANAPRIESDGMFVSERWIMRLIPEWPE